VFDKQTPINATFSLGGGFTLDVGEITMNEDPIAEALEEAIRRREDEIGRLRRALEQHRRRAVEAQPRRRRKGGLRRGSLPFQIAEILKEDGPLTTAEVVIGLRLKGVESSTRTVSSALSRYGKEGRFFRQAKDGKWELIEE
jgi:hypothetical protein